MTTKTDLQWAAKRWLQDLDDLILSTDLAHSDAVDEVERMEQLEPREESYGVPTFGKTLGEWRLAHMEWQDDFAQAEEAVADFWAELCALKQLRRMVTGGNDAILTLLRGGQE